MRREPLVTGGISHIYNRGVDKRIIFPDTVYYARFLSMLNHYLKYDYPYSLYIQRRRDCDDFRSFALSMEMYRWEHLPVEILSFCLMPNHFHLQMKQLVDSGISTFMHRVGTSYTNFFNILNDRTGRLLEGPFRSVLVTSEGQFLCLNRYIHVNPISAGLVDFGNLADWRWSSLPEYLGKSSAGICKTGDILGYFKDEDDYLDFILADFKSSERDSLKGLTIDDDFGWFEDLRQQNARLREDLKETFRRF